MMEELIERFCSVTGSNSNIASQFLQMADGDIDHAIAFYFDSDQSEQIVDSDVVITNAYDESRTPIPQKHERLIDPELPSGYNIRRRQPLDRNIFSVDPQHRPSTSIGNTNQNGSGNTLEKMFEPPVEILFNGTFEEAKELARNKNVWLLVSVHNNEIFDCHKLNRDLWKNSKIKSLVKRNFIFWQVLFNKAEAQQFVQWYDYNSEAAHLAIIDPLTGECKLRLMGPELSSTVSTHKILQEFVLNNGRTTHNTANSPRKRAYDYDHHQELVDLTESIPKIKRMKIISPSSSTSQCENELPVSDRWYDYIGQESDPIYTILIRLPSGDRDMISLPSSSKLRALFLYIGEKGCDFDNYELVKCFPKRILTTDLNDSTLDDCGIVNKDTLHVQERM